MQFTPNGWTNRNRLPDGSWLTVPVEHGDGLIPISRVRIAEHGNWRRTVRKSLQQQYDRSDALDALTEIIGRPYRLLVGLNVALLQAVFDAIPGAGPLWMFQSHLDSGSAVSAVSEDAKELLPISERLAMMVKEVGGTVYLSGPSGRNYLSEEPFAAQGIRVDYWRFDGANDCVAAHLGRRNVRGLAA